MATDTQLDPRPHQKTAPPWVRCRLCNARLAQAASSAGAFVNPHGFVHDLVVAHRAPGAEAHGPVTDAFSWFDGYAWQLAACRSCGAHVGWCYLAIKDAEPDLFFGLSRNALAPLS